MEVIMEGDCRRTGNLIVHARMTKVSTFLNRVLAMSMEDQQLLFTYFIATLEAHIMARAPNMSLS